MKKNLTLAINEKLLEKARIVAVKKRTSVTRMVNKYLESVVRSDDEYKRSCRKLQNYIQEPPLVVGNIKWTREELHERDKSFH